VNLSDNLKILKGGVMKKTLNWKEVIKVHRTVSGISPKSGLVNSLLCNAGQDKLYPNKISKNKITYYVGPNTNSSGINALFRSWGEGNSFPVFEKLGVNQWRRLGNFKVSSHKKEKGDFTAFILKKV
jgi:hypothetical protein